LIVLFTNWQSVYARLAGYEDVNDQEALTRDPAMRAVVGRRALERNAASAQTVTRFETETLATEQNIEALFSINAVWVEKAIASTHTKKIILDMDSSESPVHGSQEGSSYSGHFSCRCYHPLFVFNQFGDCEAAALRPGNVHSADGWSADLKAETTANDPQEPPKTASTGTRQAATSRKRAEDETAPGKSASGGE
jgi:hypothetical protein